MFFFRKSDTGFLESVFTIWTTFKVKQVGCLPHLQVHLLLQLSNLCFQGCNISLVFGFDRHLQFTQLLLQIFVLALELGTETFTTLGAAALCSELHIHLVRLNRHHSIKHIFRGILESQLVTF